MDTSTVYENFSDKLSELISSLPKPVGFEAKMALNAIEKDAIILQKKVKDYLEGKLPEMID